MFRQTIYTGCFMFLVITMISIKATAQQDSSPNFYHVQKQMNDLYKLKGKNYGGYKQWKREEWYTSYRIKPNGDFINTDSARIAAVTLMNNRVAARSNLVESNSGGWTFIGPNNITNSDRGIGRVNRIAFHPTDANKLYAATASGGLWYTSDAGNTWFPLTDGIPNMSLSGVVVSHADPNTIYILTGDGDGASMYGGTNAGLNRFSTGILKSVNAGVTWQFTGLNLVENNNLRSYKLIMHPGNADILFAAIGNKIYKTTDGGNNWAEVLTQASGYSNIYDIEFKPGSPNIIYACSGDSFYKSVDTGKIFNVGFSIPPLPPNSPFGGVRTGIAVTPANTNYVYLMAGPTTDTSSSTSQFRGLFLSTNNGSSFNMQSNSPSPLGNLPQVNYDQTNYDFAIAVSNTNAATVVMGGIRLYRSSNSGSSIDFISESGNSVYHADIHDLAFSPFNNKLYAATDGGIYESSDAGLTWTYRSFNMQITQYYRFSNSATNSNLIIGGAQDNGTHRRNTASPAFTKRLGADGMDCLIKPSDNSVMYATTQNGKLYRSIDAGDFFSLVLNSTGDDPWITSLAMDPNNNAVIYFLQSTYKKSFDNGVNWFPLPAFYVDDDMVGNGMAISEANSNTLYEFKTLNFPQTGIVSRITRSYDGGITNAGLVYNEEGKFITGIVANPNNADEFWVCFAGYEDGYKVLRSSNAGNSFTNISGSLPNVPVNCISFEKNAGGPSGALYIGTDIGIFYRDDNLGDWVPFSNGLPVVEVMDLEILKNDGIIRAATYGRGIYESPLYSTCAATLSLNSGNQSINHPYFHQVSSLLVSSANVIGAGADVYYKAGGNITLTPGFTADAVSGAKFTAILGPCVGGVPSGNTEAVNTFNAMQGYLITK